jgi:hypothetical protein
MTPGFEGPSLPARILLRRTVEKLSSGRVQQNGESIVPYRGLWFAHELRHPFGGTRMVGCLRFSLIQQYA